MYGTYGGSGLLTVNAGTSGAGGVGGTGITYASGNTGQTPGSALSGTLIQIVVG